MGSEEGNCWSGWQSTVYRRSLKTADGACKAFDMKVWQHHGYSSLAYNN